MRYLGVSRDEKFSPNRTAADSAVFSAVAAELERNGHQVVRMTEQELSVRGIPDDIDGIFQMARSREALDVLERTMLPVTNTAQAVRNCSRSAQISLLAGMCSIPDTNLFPITIIPEGWRNYPCWIKNADSHAVDEDDVQYVHEYAGLISAIRGFADRGIGKYVIQAHAKGWLLKFYGVRGFGLTDCYAAGTKDGKFGLEQYNDQPGQDSVDIDSLTALVERCARLLEVDVYGGDAIVGPDGGITIIDFNDWPSFRTCTVGAAQKIARLIMDKR